MQQPTNTLDRLLITAGAPPEEWLRASTAVSITAVILSFWETTVSLIENEWFLGRDQRRFLAMVRDHKVRTAEEAFGRTRTNLMYVTPPRNVSSSSGV